MIKLLKVAPLLALLSIGQLFAIDNTSDSLVCACEEKNLEEIKRLIECGASVDQAERSGWTPLHRAAYRGDLEVAELLLAYGANVDKQDNRLVTPLHLAADGKGFIAQDWVIEANPEYAEECRKPIYSREKIVRLLIENGANLNIADKEGKTPLHDAVTRMGSEKIVELLLENGAKVNQTDNRGRTPLHLTTDKEIIELLLKHGANIYQFDNRGWSPIYLWAVCGYNDAIEVAVQCGADINKEVKNSMTLLEIAYEANDFTTANVLKANGATLDMDKFLR